MHATQYALHVFIRPGITASMHLHGIPMVIRDQNIQLFHHSNLHLSTESPMTQVPVTTFHINHPYRFQVCEALHQTNVLPHLPP